MSKYISFHRPVRMFLQWAIDRDSPCYNAFMLAGFSLQTYIFQPKPCFQRIAPQATGEFCKAAWHVIADYRHTLLRFTMQCVCGTVEVGEMFSDKKTDSEFFNEETGLVDVAAWIESCGALSPKHLRRDGYSEEDIVRIRKPFTDMYAREGRADPFAVTPRQFHDYVTKLDLDKLKEYALPKKKVPYYVKLNNDYRAKQRA